MSRDVQRQAFGPYELLRSSGPNGERRRNLKLGPLRARWGYHPDERGAYSVGRYLSIETRRFTAHLLQPKTIKQPIDAEAIKQWHGDRGIVRLDLASGRHVSMDTRHLLLEWTPDYDADEQLSMLTLDEYAEVLAAVGELLPRPIV